MLICCNIIFILIKYINKKKSIEFTYTAVWIKINLDNAIMRVIRLRRSYHRFDNAKINTSIINTCIRNDKKSYPIQI